MPDGFSDTSVPTVAMVQGWIDTADAIISVQLLDISGLAPTLADRLHGLAKDYIIEYVKEQVIRTVYAGNDPLKVKQATDGYAANQVLLVTTISSFKEQATGDALNLMESVGVSFETPTRDFLITDDMLGGLNGGPRRQAF